MYFDIPAQSGILSLLPRLGLSGCVHTLHSVCKSGTILPCSWDHLVYCILCNTAPPPQYSSYFQIPGLSIDFLQSLGNYYLVSISTPLEIIIMKLKKNTPTTCITAYRMPVTALSPIFRCRASSILHLTNKPYSQTLTCRTGTATNHRVPAKYAREGTLELNQFALLCYIIESKSKPPRLFLESKD